MSQVKIQGNASGTGIFTVASPNSNTDRTLTLPDSAGTLDRLERAGNVLQVVNASSSTYSTTLSSSFVDSPLSASITPTSSTSKILVLCSLNGAGRNNASASSGANYRILRDASIQVIYLMNGLGWTNVAEYQFSSLSCSYLDTPSTTSSITYKVQFSAQAGQASFNWYDTLANTTSTLTLLEIAA